MIVTEAKYRRLALFFTVGISLRTWEKMGYLGREGRIYKRLASRLGEKCIPSLMGKRIKTLRAGSPGKDDKAVQNN